MRRLFYIAILMFPLFLTAQSDFTRDDFYKPGDTAQYFGVDATNADPGPAGIGVTWDFSNLPRRTEDDFEVSYADPSAAPNQSQFPEANMVAIQDAGQTTAYTFLNATENRIVLEGLDLPDLGVVTYTDKSEWFDLPFQFNETESDPFVGTYTFNIQGISGIADRTGRLTTIYDGFGTLILPDGTRVPNVRRLKLDQTVDDVITVSGLSITTKTITTTYHYFAEGERLQVFTLIEGDVTVTPPGSTTRSRIANYRVPEGNNQPTQASRRGPHLTTQGGAFLSEIIIRNTSDQAQSITLTPNNGQGTELPEVSLQIGASAISRTLQDDLFPASAESFSVTGCEPCVFSVGYRADIQDGSTAQVHQFGSFSREAIIYPGEWETLFDGAAIVNSGDGNTRVTATQYAYDGSAIQTVTLAEELPPGAKKLVLFNDVFASQANSFIKVQADQDLAVMALRISSDFRYLYQNTPLPRTIPDNFPRWVPHVTSETGGFTTDLLLHNQGDTAQTVTLHPYQTDGTTLANVDVMVEPGQVRRFPKAELFASETSHFSISGSRECIVSAGYRALSDGASTAMSHEMISLGKSLNMYPGEWSLLFDGVAIINTGDGPATITLTQIGDDGSELAKTTLVENLAPNAKFLGVFEGFIPDNPKSILRVESTQPMAMLSLRLSKDGRYLYNNNPQ